MDEKITFMLIDDDEDDRMLFRAALKSSSEDINLLIAADGKEAVEMLTSFSATPPDLIFVDINMPGISGWDCLLSIKADLNLNDVKIIMYSTSNNPRDIDKAMEMGACCFCSKPDSFDRLIKLIQLCVQNIEGDLRKVLIQEGICSS